MTNNVATVLVTLSVLVALVPLLWVLYSVVVKGIGAVMSPTVVHQLAGGYDGVPSGRRRVPRDRRNPAAGLGLRDHLDPDRRVRRHLPGRVRRRDAAGQDHHLHGRHPHRCAVDRRGAVHLRAVGRDAGLRAVGVRGVTCAGAADDPGDRALHRGDAAHRADGSARGELRTGRAEVEDHRPRS